MPINVTCPECGRKGKVPDRFAGKMVGCPACKEIIDVPALGQEAGNRAVAMPPASPPPADPSLPSWMSETVAEAEAVQPPPSPPPSSPPPPPIPSRTPQVLVTCPHCRFAWDVGVELAGQTVTCRKCDCRVTVRSSAEGEQEIEERGGQRRRPAELPHEAGSRAGVFHWDGNDRAQMVGLIGSALLCIGVFTPIFSFSVFAKISYLDNFRLDGVAVLLLALGSAFLALSPWRRGLWITGEAALAVLNFTLAQFVIAKVRLGAELEHEAAKNPIAASFRKALIDAYELQWGWLILLGACPNNGRRAFV